jgi:hypothetical protein
MHYTKNLTVPAGTASGSPASTTIDLPPGVLEEIAVLFPPGCARMVSTAIFDGATQIYPKDNTTSYAEDAKEISVRAFEIFDATKTLTLKGWAPSTNYQHKLTFTFNMKSAEEIAMSRTGY